MKFSKEEPQYRIINLYVNNIKGIKAVDITPSDDLVQIKGKNGQGKSSVLDSIIYGFAGNRHIPENVIKNDTDKGTIIIDCGDFKIEKVLIEGQSPRLKVLSNDGSEFKSPQSVLNGFVGGLAFDPLEFGDLSSEKQRDELASLLGVKDQLDEVMNEYDTIYKERTTIGQTKRLFDSRVKDCPTWVEVKKSDIDKLQEEIYEAKGASEKRDIYETELKNFELRLEKNKNEYEKLLQRAKEIKEETVEINKNIDNYKNKIEKMENIDEDLLKKKTEELNEKISQKEKQNDYEKALEDAEKYKEQYNILTRKLDEQKIKMDEIIEGVDSPIDGLKITESGVTYNGVDLHTLSTTEKLKVGLMILIKQNPQLRVAIIQRGESIDSDGMKVLSDIAKKNNFQIWLEIVSNNVEGEGFYIVDGKAEEHPF